VPESPAPRSVAPYLAVGLSTVIYGISERKQIRHNLENIEEVIHAAVSMVNINMPVKIIALAEGALTGFTDEIFDLPHVMAARDLFIDIPGEETEHLGRLAKLYNTYIIGQCKARWPEVMADRYFNTLFVIGPNGKVVHKAAKNHVWCRERSCVPHDVYDRWVELYGDGIEAFYPVLKTDDIGNIGTICCSDGEYPEAVRALAFNGAEVVYRPSEATPMTTAGYPGGGTWMIQNQGHAEFNSVYMLCPNAGPVYLARPRSTRWTSPGAVHISSTTAGRSCPTARLPTTAWWRPPWISRPAPVPRHEPQQQLAEGSAHRAVCAHVRKAHPSEKSLAERRAEVTCRGGRDLSGEHPASCRSRHLDQTGRRPSGLPLSAGRR
jgi:predicted amidohydrolase